MWYPRAPATLVQISMLRLRHAKQVILQHAPWGDFPETRQAAQDTADGLIGKSPPIRHQQKRVPRPRASSHEHLANSMSVTDVLKGPEDPCSPTELASNRATARSSSSSTSSFAHWAYLESSRSKPPSPITPDINPSIETQPTEASYSASKQPRGEKDGYGMGWEGKDTDNWWRGNREGERNEEQGRKGRKLTAASYALQSSKIPVSWDVERPPRYLSLDLAAHETAAICTSPVRATPR